MKKLTEKKIKSDLVYQGSFLKVLRDEVELPNGKKGLREYIPHPGAAMVVPITDEGHLVMIRQFRYPLGKEFIEFPAGKIDSGEEAIQTARRELLEETGYTAKDMKHLTSIHPVIGYSNEVIEIFVANHLSLSEQRLDEEEFIDVFEVSLSEVVNLMRHGKITDVKTMIGIFWYQQILLSGW
ncbi:MAG: NUDIX hydrolase [Bdellovibrionaceae bacterium]|nr:NUDIX hydrolase [Pseudobdellovibrionaceae bacterium]